ncbi:MAG TPA: response regulator [Alphaproteobacteria bacterium]|nr:response regulator [Alphaproteobacteria bacterium]
MTVAPSSLAGKRILLVEDEVLVAMMIEEILLEFGCEVVGPVSRIDAARAAIEDDGFDCALLDINLRGQPVYPVAELLAEHEVPFGFITGYGAAGVPAKFGTHPVLQKPFDSQDVAAMLVRLTRKRRKAAPSPQ